jgi:hypothetical protein
MVLTRAVHFCLIKVLTEFLDEIQTKVLRVFLLDIHSHLYFLKLTQPLTCLLKPTKPLTVSTVQFLYTVKERKPDRKPYPLPDGLKIHTETLLGIILASSAAQILNESAITCTNKGQNSLERLSLYLESQAG